VRQRVRLLALPLVLLYAAGILEAVDLVRQRRRGVRRSLVTSPADRDPRSTWLLVLTWWPAGAAALLAAIGLPQLNMARRWRRRSAAAGAAVTTVGIALRQWSIRSLGQYFVGHVVVQPDQTVVASGPYRWLRHPSYAGQWLEMVGVGLSTGNTLGLAICSLVPLVGITARITGEERELLANLPGYGDYAYGRRRLVPFIW